MFFLKNKILKIKNKFYYINNNKLLNIFKIFFFYKINKLIINIKNNNLYKKKNINNILNKIKKNIKNIIYLKYKSFNNRKTNINHKYIDITKNKNNNKNIGSIHPITESCYRIENFFNSIGFNLINGSEIETEFTNFISLNNPENHPARSMHDTFYINKYDKNKKFLLLRTHTSSIQIKYAKFHKPPIKIITIGKVYRIDNDPTHSPMFHQVEGLWIDKNINFANFKNIYLNFIKYFFNNNKLLIRFRSSYFPFTEPSVEIDIKFKKGFFKKKWLEISGAGQIHPIVMKNMNINSEKYIGFAFGSGIERLTMLRYNINNIKLFYKNNLNFLKQFY